MEIRKIPYCINHLTPRDKRVFIPPEDRPQGVGNCYDCKPDDKNRNCRDYSPLTIHIIDFRTSNPN